MEFCVKRKLFINGIVKNKKIYMITFLLTLTLMTICATYETNLFANLFEYITNDEYRNYILNIYNDHNYFQSMFKLL